MKKIALALTLMLALLISAIAGAKLVNWAGANPYPYTNCDSSFVTVSILSPENKTYDTNSILVTIFAGAYPGVMGAGCSIDSGPLTDLAPGKWNGHTFNESVFLNGLSKGSHNIVAKAITWKAPNDIVTAYSQVYFTITKTLEPQSPSPSPTVTPTPTPTLAPSPTPTQGYGLNLFLPTLQIVALFGITAAIGVILLVYFKKRKH